MPTNPYLNHLGFTNTNEQLLYNNLIQEAIRNYGMDVIYIPKTISKLDLLFGEDVLKKFEKYYPIEMYFESVDGFSDDRNFLSKFGLEIRKQANFVVSVDRFSQEVQDDPSVAVRPNEGDLIYMPLTRDLFEIVFVDHEAIFWQLGKVFVWRILVEKFAYSSEEINTGIPDIDTIETNNTMVQGPIFTIQLESGGWGYTTAPTVVITGGGGSGASAIATINTNGNVISVSVSFNPLTFVPYTSPPTITFTGGNGYGARARAILVDNNYGSKPGSNNTLIQNDADEILDFLERDPFSGGNY